MAVFRVVVPEPEIASVRGLGTEALPVAFVPMLGKLPCQFYLVLFVQGFAFSPRRDFFVPGFRNLLSGPRVFSLSPFLVLSGFLGPLRLNCVAYFRRWGNGRT